MPFYVDCQNLTHLLYVSIIEFMMFWTIQNVSSSAFTTRAFHWCNDFGLYFTRWKCMAVWFAGYRISPLL